MTTVGERIKAVRKEKGMTLEELAKAIDTTPQTIFKYEKNIVTNVPSDKIEKIAIVLNVSPAYLMGWEQKHFKDLENNPDALKEGYDENIKYLMEHEGGHLVDLYKELINNESLILLMDKATKLKPADVANLIRIADAFEKETFGDKDEAE